MVSPPPLRFGAIWVCFFFFSLLFLFSVSRGGGWQGTPKEAGPPPSPPAPLPNKYSHFHISSAFIHWGFGVNPGRFERPPPRVVIPPPTQWRREGQGAKTTADFIPLKKELQKVENSVCGGGRHRGQGGEGAGGPPPPPPKIEVLHTGSRLRPQTPTPPPGGAPDTRGGGRGVQKHRIDRKLEYLIQGEGGREGAEARGGGGRWGPFMRGGGVLA